MCKAHHAQTFLFGSAAPGNKKPTKESWAGIEYGVTPTTQSTSCFSDSISGLLYDPIELNDLGELCEVTPTSLFKSTTQSFVVLNGNNPGDADASGNTPSALPDRVSLLRQCLGYQDDNLKRWRMLDERLDVSGSIASQPSTSLVEMTAKSCLVSSHCVPT